MVHEEYYLIRSDVLPEVFHKVILVKQLVDREDGLSINEACKRVNISRSAFYKYRDSVRLVQSENISTLSIILELENLDNIVYRCVKALRAAGSKVQSFQISESQLGNKFALITVEANSDASSLSNLKNNLQQVRGVKSVTIRR